MKHLAFGILILALAGAALLLRLPRLDQRPMHSDEAVHAVKFADLWQTGAYRYDPHEFHGPSLYYFTLPSAWLSPARTFAQTTEFTYRIVPVLFGVGLILLLWPLRAGLGTPATIAAAALTAVSPAMVYYSRYYIHETPFVFFTLAAIVCGWRWTQTRRLLWMLACGAAVGLIHATKETSAIVFLCALAALPITALWTRFALRLPRTPHPSPKTWHLALGALAAAVVSIAFFSSFFTNWQGPLDSILTYMPWGNRAGESFHNHPWYWYLSILTFSRQTAGPVWSEALILALAAIGTAAALAGKAPNHASRPLLVFLAFFTAFMAEIYSLIPYKTPWCMLGFLHGLILLAGVGTATLFHLLRRLRPTVSLAATFLCAALLILGTVHLARQAQSASLRFAADPRNPYAYAQPVPDVLNLARRAQDLAAASPQGHNMVIKVISADRYYWPLPWYLRDFPRVGYYESIPPSINAPLVLVMPELQATLAPRLADEYRLEYFGLRPQVAVMTAIRHDLWDAFMRTRTGTAPAATKPTTQPATTRPGAALSLSQPTARDVHHFSHDAMAGTFDIFLVDDDPDHARQAADACWIELDRLEAQLSRFIPSSDISRINNLAANQSATISDDAMNCLQAAALATGDTAGAFDVTIGPLLACWKSKDGPRTPTDPELQAAKAKVGMHLLKLDPDHHRVTVLADGMKIDLGGIGKGYAVDRLAALLRESSITSALISAGQSSILAMGHYPGRRGWDIGVRDPRDPDRPLQTLSLLDESLSGSGLSVRGRHIIDPRTGQPAAQKQAAWAFAPTATLSDILSTAFMIMTPQQIDRYVTTHPPVRAMLLDETTNRLILLPRPTTSATSATAASSPAPPTIRQ